MVVESPLPSQAYAKRYPGTSPPKSVEEAGRRNAQDVLIVDDDRFFRSLLRLMLGQTGFHFSEIREAEDSESALRICASLPVDLVFCDLNLTAFRSTTGLQVIRSVRDMRPSLPIFMVTSANSESLTRQACEAGATGQLLKPINLRTLKRLLNSQLAVKAITPDAAESDAPVPPSETTGTD